MLAIGLGAWGLILLVAVTVAIRRSSRKWNFGTPPDQLSSGWSMDVAVTWGGRMFDPNLYVLVVAGSCFGLTTRSRFGKFFYPSWWFRPGDVAISRTMSHQLWKTSTARPGLTCRYRHHDEDLRLDIVDGARKLNTFGGEK